MSETTKHCTGAIIGGKTYTIKADGVELTQTGGYTVDKVINMKGSTIVVDRALNVENAESRCTIPIKMDYQFVSEGGVQEITNYQTQATTVSILYSNGVAKQMTNAICSTMSTDADGYLVCEFFGDPINIVTV